MSLGAAVALLFGVELGRTVDDRPRPPGPPPPGVAPPDQARGRPGITLNQDNGDGNTTFVVHGTGLVPGQKVMVRLDRSRVSTEMPVVDFAGTFNYGINQSHEFFPGKIPSGRHRVTVTVPGADGPMEATFTVNDL